MTTPRRPWFQWLLLTALVLAIALGVARALNKRADQRDAATQAAAARQQAPVYELTAADVVAVQPLTLAQTVDISGSLKALQTASIKARVAGEVQGLR
ncbi:MAG: efflux transporter periplasmic adaptor subunit, partial [Hydrogenophaga sp.]|nr:efflux transporter periplasmic adaptor subunit [Hydrogenophaga sp.]